MANSRRLPLPGPGRESGLNPLSFPWDLRGKFRDLVVWVRRAIYRLLRKKLPSPGRSVLSGVATACLLAGCSADPEEALESAEAQRFSLLARLHEVEVLDGIPGASNRYLRLDQDPLQERGSPRVRLRVAPACTLRFPRMELPLGSEVEVHVGVEWFDAESARRAREQDLGEARLGFEILFQSSATDPPVPLASLRTGISMQDLEAGHGPVLMPIDRDCFNRPRVGHLLLRTRCEFPVEGLVPTWWSPTLVVPPSPAGLAAQREVEVLHLDLLRHPVHMEPDPDGGDLVTLGEYRVREADGTIRLDEPGRRVQHPAVQIEAHFDAGSSPQVPRGGAWPALAFAGKGTVRYELPDLSAAARLQFEAAFHAMPEPVEAGTARVRVLLDGEPILERVFQAPTRLEEQGRFATTEVAFEAGRPSALAAPRVLEIEVSCDALAEPLELPLPAGEPGTSRFLLLTQPLFGLCRPRIVESIRVTPQPMARGESAARRPNVLFLCVETLRADELGCYGGAPDTTPRLDQWSRRGLVFERAYAPSPWTLPSVATLLSGLPPWRHGAVSGEMSEYLPDSLRTLGEHAEEAGIRTAAIVTNFMLEHRTGFAAGFDTFIKPFAADAAQVNQLFLDWLTTLSGARFLAYLHYFDPHAPLHAPGAFLNSRVPPGLRERDYDQEIRRLNERIFQAGDVAGAEETLAYLRGRYRGEVAYLDAQIGSLLDTLEAHGLLDNTLVIFTADHGEEFGEHRTWGHGSQVYEESIRVPMILWGAGVEAGRHRRPVTGVAASYRAAASLGLTDFVAQHGAVPALPLTADPGWSGQLPAIATEKGYDLQSRPWPGDDAGRSERVTPRPHRALFLGDHKLVVRLRRLPEVASRSALEAVVDGIEYYDLAKDPGEQDSLAHSLAELPAAATEALLAQLEEELARPAGLPTMRPAPDSMAALEALGYLRHDH